MNGIRVLEPGLLTTVQDLGRWGYQHDGMVVAGAMDTLSLQIANILVGNARNTGCLEITLLGPKLEFLTDTVIAITGADLAPRLNGRQIKGWAAHFVNSGSILEFSGLRSGCRAYLAISGGLDLPLIMGSVSTYLRGRLGGFGGRPLQRDDVLPVKLSCSKQVSLPSWYLTQPRYQQKKKIRVVLGPEAGCFTAEGLRTFFSSSYTITGLADRMGYRLEGPSVESQRGNDIISDGISFGSIQIPTNGMPIILLADRQTTGGYTRIATVISVDLPLIGQSSPGDILDFSEVSVDEAQNLYLQMETILQSLANHGLKFTRNKP